MNDKAKQDATDHLSRHASLITSVARDSADLHRKMEEHGRALNIARRLDDPAVHPPQ